MAKIAKVELLDGASYSVRGRTFVKGCPQVIGNPADIVYYQTQSAFRVELLDVPDQPAVPEVVVQKAPEPKAESFSAKLESAPASEPKPEPKAKAVSVAGTAKAAGAKKTTTTSAKRKKS